MIEARPVPDLVQQCEEFCKTCMSGDTCAPMMNDEPCYGLLKDEIDRLRKAIRSFEGADTEMRRAEATMEQPRLQRAGNRFATARYRLFLAAKQPKESDSEAAGS